MAQVFNESKNDLEGCVMLALSTFRKSDKTVEAAMEKCRKIKKLMIVFVVDVNVARYLVGVEEEFAMGVKESCEAELLEKAEKEGREQLEKISKQAEQEGFQVQTLVKLGRFAVVCLDVVNKIHPSLIVTTRSRRPEWVKKFFGAPVDELISKAGCPVQVV